MSAAALAPKARSGSKTQRRSIWRARPGRRSGSPMTGMKNFPSPAIGRRPRCKLRCCRRRKGRSRTCRVPGTPAPGRLIYPAEGKELVDFDVISNLPPGAPFRGPGGPPMAFALEQAIDEAALRMKLDPIALRKRWDPNPNRQRLYDGAADLDVWRNRKTAAAQTGRYRRGVGVASGYWLYLWQPGVTIELA